jgi:glycosyltransferase involved in cell wall biosynthesis
MNGVSCLCLTYGRPHLLEESIESFLRQDYDGPTELIVLNDHPEQQLVYKGDPRVVVFNITRRLRTLGAKRNLSVALSSYNNLLVWDDDDIYLPWRIQETMKVLPHRQFFKCPNAWVMNNGVIEKEIAYNLFHAGAAYTRWVFEKIGGYHCINTGEDADFEGRIKGRETRSCWGLTQLPPERLYYIYRWSHGSYHATHYKDLADLQPRVTKGEIYLRPQWRQNYTELAASLVPTVDSAVKAS